MNYKGHYNKLIERAKYRNKPKFAERHHIIPRSIGGNDNIENLVYLTPEEHFVAHQLLVKIYPEYSFQLIHALNMMTVESSNTPRSNKRYGWIKRKYIAECKKRIGNKNPSFGKKWYHDPETGKAKKFVPGYEPENWRKSRVLRNKCTVCGVELHSCNARFCYEHRKKVESKNGKKGNKERKNKNIEKDREIFTYAITSSKTWIEAIKKAGFKTDGYSRVRLKEFARKNNLSLLNE